MRKHSLFAVLLALLFALCAGCAFAATSGYFTYLPGEDMAASLVSYSGPDSSVSIPPMLDGYTLKEIGPGAFTSNRALESVTVPDGAVSIKSGTFSECRNLSRVSLPASLRRIEKNAFFRCESLTALTIPAGVTFIGENAFAQCPQLTLTVTEDSFAHQYAEANDIPFRLK